MKRGGRTYRPKSVSSLLIRFNAMLICGERRSGVEREYVDGSRRVEEGDRGLWSRGRSQVGSKVLSTQVRR